MYMQGVVTRVILDKGFGFVQAQNVDYFFHRSAVKDDGFKDLHEGQEVEFEPAPPGPKGPRAASVDPI
jgi:cold shock protein